VLHSVLLPLLTRPRVRLSPTAALAGRTVGSASRR